MKDQTIFVSAAWRTPLGRRNRTSQKVPSLRLMGEWLREAGFKEGARVTVSAEQKRLVLTVEE